jgi:hypothetical protein
MTNYSKKRMMIPGTKPVILTEFLSNKEREELESAMREKRKPVLPDSRRPCILCTRYAIAYFFINARSECNSLKSSAIFSRTHNIPDVNGEYLFEDCIMNTSKEYYGLPAPVVLHNRYNYEQSKHIHFLFRFAHLIFFSERDDKGIYWYIQKYRKPEEVNITGLVFP